MSHQTQKANTPEKKSGKSANHHHICFLGLQVWNTFFCRFVYHQNQAWKLTDFCTLWSWTFEGPVLDSMDQTRIFKEEKTFIISIYGWPKSNIRGCWHWDLKPHNLEVSSRYSMRFMVPNNNMFYLRVGWQLPSCLTRTIPCSPVTQPLTWSNSLTCPSPLESMSLYCIYRLRTCIIYIYKPKWTGFYSLHVCLDSKYTYM